MLDAPAIAPSDLRVSALPVKRKFVSVKETWGSECLVHRYPQLVYGIE